MSGVDVTDEPAITQSHIQSIRECARRLLTSSSVMLICPAKKPESKNWGVQFHNLIINLMDLNPALVISIEQESHIADDSKMKIFADGVDIVQFGGAEPKLESVCWVIGDLNIIWNYFKKNCLDLAHAGYPGCENCFGESFGKDWSEKTSREMMKISGQK